MGLDQYFYKARKNISEEEIQKLDREKSYGNINRKRFEEVAKSVKYFNKNYELQEIVFEIWQKKKKNDDIDSFNCQFLNLTKEDIEFIIESSEDERVIEFLKEALKKLEKNNIFFYSSW